MPQVKAPSILYVSSFPPRECGIATFTQDLTNAIDLELNPGIKSKILALNVNGTSLYNYPARVAMQLNDADLEDYLRAVHDINRLSDVKLVNIQHEYGLYGGNWGNYLLPFLEMLQKPKVITLHTVLPRPRPDLKKITRDLLSKVDGVVVMTKTAERLLRRTYDVPASKPIFVIPHGVHHVTFPSKSKAKHKLNLAGRTILSTFGMLNRDKGIEYAIAALPEVIQKYPNVLYLVLGATHPIVARQEGERYRNKLTALVKKLKLEDHVKFYNKYLELNELIDFLKATDIYISPTLNVKQAVSGTVSYALSCACPIIATKNQYAKDIINHERGLLVDLANSEQIKKALLTMLDDQKMLKEMRKACYYYSRHMTWQNVALSYFARFNQFAKIVPKQPDRLPPISLAHIKTLTDDFGMIQFAAHTKPDKYAGYCLDDNTRALLGCVKYYQKHASDNLLKLIRIYFNYLRFSQKGSGHFYDFINHNRTINTANPESEDSLGRATWALGVTQNSPNLPPELIKQAAKMCQKARPAVKELQFSRAIAFALIGLTNVYAYETRLVAAGEIKPERLAVTKELIVKLADQLLRNYQKQINKNNNNQSIVVKASSVAKTEEDGSTDKWQWFDDHLTYSNFKLPESLFLTYQIIKDHRYLEVAQTALEFLTKITFGKGYYNAIGQDGWYFRNGKRAYFDQQPEDAASAVEGLLAAFSVAKKKVYSDQAKLAFAWFLGKNHLHQMVYDEATGGCYDGLGKNSINFNQGAESTISYFLARLAMDNL